MNPRRPCWKGLERRGFRVLNDVVLNQVLVTPDDGTDVDELTAAVQGSGVCWFAPATWNGTRAIRLSVSSWATTDDDIEAGIEAIAAQRRP